MDYEWNCQWIANELESVGHPHELQIKWNQSEILWESFGDAIHLRSIRNTRGIHLKSMGSPIGTHSQSIDVIRMVSNGFPMAFSWISNEFQIDFQWITDGFADGVLALWNPFDIRMKAKSICPMHFKLVSNGVFRWVPMGLH